MVTEVINYYRKNGSSVYMCMLDASKAFDRVNLFEAVDESKGVNQGGVLSPILFSLYLDQVVSRLRHIGMGCHMNGLFTGVFIYADDIMLLAPSRTSLTLMLEQWESFPRTHDILFNASKTKYMIFKHHEIVNVAPLYFKGSPINFVHECDLLCITLSSKRPTVDVIAKAVMKLNIKSNE